MDLNDYAESIYRTCKEHGFTTPASIHEVELTLAKLMLIVTEVSEAAEHVRLGDFIALKEELADILIRTLHLARGLGIDIQMEVLTKMEINKRRPYRHGKLI